jgi:hypothetical protein
MKGLISILIVFCYFSQVVSASQSKKELPAPFIFIENKEDYALENKLFLYEDKFNQNEESVYEAFLNGDFLPLGDIYLILVSAPPFGGLF